MTAVRDAVAVVTGGGSGIGAALARRFAQDGAAAVVVSDRDGAAAARVADAITGGLADTTDVTEPDQVQAMVERTLQRFGRIDILCSNAGIAPGIGLDGPLATWDQTWRVNLLSHVHLAHHVVPAMLERGSGHIVITASAAGLLTTPGDAAYTVTKHGAVGLAEWLAVEYGDRGIGVGVLCPMGVATPLLLGPLEDGSAMAQAVAASGDVIAPERVADTVVDALADGRFLILPHPEVARFWAQKASDPDRWLAGVRRLVERQHRGEKN